MLRISCLLIWCAAAVAGTPTSGTETCRPGETARLEEGFRDAVARGDIATARVLDRRLDAFREKMTSCPSWTEPVVGRADRGQKATGGGDVPVDTNQVRAFAVEADGEGNLWVAAAGADTRVRLYRSGDMGSTWEHVLWFSHGVDVPKLELVYAGGDSARLYVFYLAGLNAGDIGVVRLHPDSLTWDTRAVATGPDTISDFSVAADRDRHYYLYCFYANEAGTGPTGRFTRSLDQGRTWELPQVFWNCWDPCVTSGGGSTVHCAWRYAATGREIHAQTNRYLGRLRGWSGYQRLSGRDELCRDPVLAQADTGYEWNAAVWAVYSVARRGEERLDIEYSYSTNGGASWTTARKFGDRFTDEWSPDLRSSPRDPSGHVHLVYRAGQRDGPGKTSVLWRCVNRYDPEAWSEAVPLNADRAHPDGAPRVVAPFDAPHRWPGAVFSRHDSEVMPGVLFNAPWCPGGPPGDRNPAPGRAAWRDGRIRLCGYPGGRATATVFDAAGRTVARLSLEQDGTARWNPGASGTYFVATTSGGERTISKLLVLRPR